MEPDRKTDPHDLPEIVPTEADVLPILDDLTRRVTAGDTGSAYRYSRMIAEEYASVYRFGYSSGRASGRADRAIAVEVFLERLTGLVPLVTGAAVFLVALTVLVLTVVG